MNEYPINAYLSPRRIFMVKELRTKLEHYFRGKGFTTSKKYPFILSDWNDWSNNIIHKRVVDYIMSIKAERKGKKSFPLHKYLHHGLSSQAFLFNLLGPVIIDKHFAVFDLILEKTGAAPKGKVSSVELEIEDREIFEEKTAQPTSVDLVITTTASENYFVEFKFTEAEFGGCSLFFNGDCDGRNPATIPEMCYLHVIGRTYWPLMKKHGLLTRTVIQESRCPFIDLYQAYRVVLFAVEKKGKFILIHDDRNPAFYIDTQKGKRGVFARFIEYLPPSIQQECHIISTQDILKIIKNILGPDYTKELEDKYF